MVSTQHVFFSFFSAMELKKKKIRTWRTYPYLECYYTNQITCDEIIYVIMARGGGGGGGHSIRFAPLFG